MRRKTTTLCLALAGALMASPAFAQGENVTFKLKNADMEQGLKGWTCEGVDLMSTNKKNPATQVGFHGMNQGVLETWHADYTQPLGNSSVMQRVQGLPNGTYVFGAYVGAALQYNREDVCERDAEGNHIYVDGMHQYGPYRSNRESINGVSLFANKAAIPVATDNPDLGNRDLKWGHSSKFNVAVQVTDGTLEVGLRIEATNANYVVWDNATLYYFGDMNEAEALDAMAEMDMTQAVAIADTLVSVKMNADSLANLKAAIATANATTTTALTLWDDNEDLYWYMGLARESEADYQGLKKKIEAAKVVLGGTWTQGSTPALLPTLEAAIASAEQAYVEAALDRAGLIALRKELSWAVGDVKVDSVYAAKDDLYAFILEVARVLNRPGGYSSTQLEGLSTLEAELNDVLKSYKSEMDAKLPLEERKVNPNALLPYIERVYAAIENVRNNPIPTEYTKMPLTIAAGEDGWMEGTVTNSVGLKEYTSSLYRFENKVETVVFTVKRNQRGEAFFTLSELSVFDAEGVEIELTEDNLYSDYDHNTLNPYYPDGDGLGGLVDDDPSTFFHSAWNNIPAGYHSIKVTLPNGGYDAFSFRMIGRAVSNGWDQSHQFPAEVVISTPMPNRDALVAYLDEAKGLNPYSSPVAEPGFYKTDFSALCNAIAEAEAALEGYPSEEECREMYNTLNVLVDEFYAADWSYYMPEAGKSYRIVSAFPAFYEKQGVHKAITFNDEQLKLWWEDANAESQMQEFVFEPLAEPIYNSNGSLLENGNLYTMQHVETGLYVSYAGSDQFALTEEPAVVALLPLGAGQFNIRVFHGLELDENRIWLSYSYETLHTGDHNSGEPVGSQGYHGGLWGVASGICSYAGGLDGGSAWYIREMAEMPWTVSAGNATAYRSEFIHLYEPTNSLFLTAANKNCAFEGLTIYDLYGNVVPATVEVEGRGATVVLDREVTSFSFALNNKEKVKQFTIDVEELEEHHVLTMLQAAYDAAVAVAPIKGTGVGMYLDLSEYEAVLAYAESLLAGDASDEEMQGAIEMLNAAVANLVPNMPDPNRLYYIVSAFDAFEEYHGVEMMMYADAEVPMWTYANTINENRYWQFESAGNQGGYYLKNVATGMYLGYKGSVSVPLAMVKYKAQTVPYTITILQGDVVAIAPMGYDELKIHANQHGQGVGKGSNIVYWNDGFGSASAWRICEVEAYELDYAMYMFRANAEAGESTNVTIELENPAAVTAVEFDLCLPEGVTLENVVVDDVRVSSAFVVNSTLLEGNVYRVSLELNEGALLGYSGALFDIVLQTASNMATGEYAISLSNIVVTALSGEKTAVADFASSIIVTKHGPTTCVDAVETVARIYGVDGAVVAVCQDDIQLGVYTMAGQLVKQWSVKPGKNTVALPAGIYLINGQKVIVK